MDRTVSEKQLKFRRMGFAASCLAACALHDTVPVLDDELDLRELYRFCKFHSITSIVAMALEKVWEANPAEEAVMKKWRQARDKAIRKNILLNAERERILAHLESIGCWYMPLKGSLLQFDYPKFGMRQMGDNDILYDKQFQSVIHDYMCAQGYEAVVYQKGNHDEYVKQPVYNVEMHEGLFMESIVPELFAYYRDIKTRMIRDTDNQYGYHLSDEDFYIYLIAHAYKHYMHSGIGIRILLDVYVYTMKHGKLLDWPYITGELRKFGADVFEAQCRQLGTKLFAGPVPELSGEEWRQLDIYFTSGTFGTEERAMENALRASENGSGKMGKLRYLLRRLFPSVRYMIEMEPELESKRWKIPFAYVRRLFRGIFCRTADISREISLLSSRKIEK